MIIDEIYDINNKNIPNFLTVREYDNSIIRNIVSKLNRQQHIHHKKCLLFVGFEVYIRITDSNLFKYSTISKNKIPEYIGSVYNYDVYYDSNLKSDQYIIGENKNEIIKYVSHKQRKAKLKNIENNVQ